MLLPIDRALGLSDLTDAGLRRYTEARERGLLLTVDGEAVGQLDKLWTTWCADHGNVRIWVHRYRGVDNPSWSELKTSFLDLASVELAFVMPGRCISPRGISAIGKALHYAGVAGNQSWSLAPYRLGVSRLPVGADERLARALVRISRYSTFTVAQT